MSNIIPFPTTFLDRLVAIQQVESSWSTPEDPCEGWIVGYRDRSGWAKGKTVTETDTFAAALEWAKSFSAFATLTIVEVDANGSILCMIDSKAGPAGASCEA